jgi:hypothetical protein
MCCGKSRSTISQPPRTGQGSHAGNIRPSSVIATQTPHSAARQPARSAVAYFQYLGKSAMTVIGPVTKAVYRFNASGHRVIVDLRDRQSLAAIPQLTEVRSL